LPARRQAGLERPLNLQLRSSEHPFLGHPINLLRRMAMPVART